MKYIAAFSMLMILISYGYIIGTWLHKDKGQPIWAIIVATSPIWVLILWSIVLILNGDI